jgi:hypothetical protein
MAPEGGEIRLLCLHLRRPRGRVEEGRTRRSSSQQDTIAWLGIGKGSLRCLAEAKTVTSTVAWFLLAVELAPPARVSELLELTVGGRCAIDTGAVFFLESSFIALVRSASSCWRRSMTDSWAAELRGINAEACAPRTVKRVEKTTIVASPPITRTALRSPCGSFSHSAACCHFDHRNTPPRIRRAHCKLLPARARSKISLPQRRLSRPASGRLGFH